MKTNNEQIREFQREYLSTWRIFPCEFCEGIGKVMNAENDHVIVCPKCKGRKVE